MRASRWAGVVLAGGLAVAPIAPSDDVVIDVGDFAAGFEGDWMQSPVASFGELQGKVVFVELWRTW